MARVQRKRLEPGQTHVVRRLTRKQFGCALAAMFYRLPGFIERDLRKVTRQSSSWSTFFVLAAGCWFSSFAAPAASPPPRQWQPGRDEVFLQEVGRKVASAEPLSAVAVFEGKVYAGSEKGLYQLDGDRLAAVPELQDPITRLVKSRNALWAMTSRGLHRYQTGGWRKISDEAVTDITEHLDDIVAAIGNRLWRLRGRCPHR